MSSVVLYISKCNTFYVNILISDHYCDQVSIFYVKMTLKSIPEGAFLILIVVIVFLTLMSISNECEIPCRTLLGHVERQRASVRGQEWVEKRRRVEEKWEEKLIIYSPQVLAHY